MAKEFIEYIPSSMRGELGALIERAEDLPYNHKLAALSQSIAAEEARFMTEGRIIDLDQIIGTSGTYANARERAMDLTERVLESCCGPGSLVQVIGPGRYYLAYPDLAKDEAELRSHALIAELCRVLKFNLSVEHEIAYNLDCMEMDENGQVKRRQSHAPTEGDAYDTYRIISESFRQKLVGEHLAERNTRKKKRAILSKARQAFSSRLALRHPNAFEDDEEDYDLGEMETRYWPVWRLENRYVIGSLQEPVLDFAPALNDAFTQARRNWKLVRDMAQIDEISAHHLSAAMHGKEAIEQGLMMLPLHYSTLNNVYLFEAMQQALEEFEDDMRKRLAIEIIGIPGDLSPGRLGKQVEQLSELARSILVTIDFESLDTPTPKDIAALSVQGLGVRINSYNVGASTSQAVGDWAKAQEMRDHKKQKEEEEERLLLRLTHLGRICRQNGCDSYFWGVTRDIEAALAVAAGISYITGPAIAEANENPFTIQSFAHSPRLKHIMRHFSGAALNAIEDDEKEMDGAG